MIWLLALHLVVGVVVVGWGKRLGRRGAWFALLAPIATLAWLATRWSAISGGTPHAERIEWIRELGLAVTVRVDGFSALMILLVSGVGSLVFLYAATYLPSTGPRVGRLVGLLVLFGGAMLGLVVADNLLVIYGFWELTSVTSFLLIGNDHEKPEARAAALQAFLITGAGGLAMLGGFLILGSSAGTFELSGLLANPPTGTTVSVAIALVLLGAFTKSAQVPFHSWLPGAMVAPTPVSAYLHSATMVKAGVFLIARLAPTFSVTLTWWRPVVVGVGVATMLTGGVRALRQHDLKLLLAHGTVSQLGFLVAIFGIGTAEAMVAGSALLLAHAAFKATNFMAVGIVDHQFGTRDLRFLPRLDRSWATTVAATVIGAASMAGIPLTFGFIAKELDFDAAFALSGMGWIAKVGVVVGAMLTAGYSLRFAAGLLGRQCTEPVDREPSAVTPGFLLVAPMLALTAMTLGLGLVPAAADRLMETAGAALHSGSATVHLAIWHGVNAPLLASLAALVVGVVLHLQRRRVSDLIVAAGSHVPDGNDGYRGALQGLNWTADRVVRYAQPGALPIYAGVVLLVAAILPIWAFQTHGGWPGFPELVEVPAHVPVSAVLIGSALAAAAVRRRFSAALFLGVTGYAMAALFAVQGAPDLALTQAAIETLSTVLFVLVLRRLPDAFMWAPDSSATNFRERVRERITGSGRPADSPMTNRTRAIRLAVSAIVGASVFVLAMVMSAPDPTTPASDAMIERSLPDGHGRNVVNVILVDFRGIDTLGEITVLACAAIGTVALARAGRRPARGTDIQRTSLRRNRPSGFDAGREQPSEHRALPRLNLDRVVVLDVTVRLVFAAVMVGSIYLLFAGHNQPGGGFAGGILAGAAVSLRFIAGGIEAVRSLSRARPWTVLGVGILLSVGTAIAPLVFGDPVLSSAYRAVDVPLLGSVSLSSVLVFDIGVYLAVLALALMMFESFGDPETEPNRDGDDAPVNAEAGAS